MLDPKAFLSSAGVVKGSSAPGRSRSKSSSAVKSVTLIAPEDLVDGASGPPTVPSVPHPAFGAGVITNISFTTQFSYSQAFLDIFPHAKPTQKFLEFILEFIEFFFENLLEFSEKKRVLGQYFRKIFTQN